MTVLLVALGGGAGASGRYLLARYVPAYKGFPAATFAANVIGCFLLGLFTGGSSFHRDGRTSGDRLLRRLVHLFDLRDRERRDDREAPDGAFSDLHRPQSDRGTVRCVVGNPDHGLTDPAPSVHATRPG